MRVISGIRRGKKLFALEGLETRPTTDRVKETLFNVLQFSLEGVCFLDAFAGSGQIGIEALSRGAGHAVMIDSSPEAVKIIRKNVSACGFENRAEIVLGDLPGFLIRNSGRYDIAFLDPPYESDLIEKALPLVANGMNPGGLVVCEHPTELRLPESVDGIKIRKIYKCGRASLTLYETN